MEECKGCRKPTHPELIKENNHCIDCCDDIQKIGECERLHDNVKHFVIDNYDEYIIFLHTIENEIVPGQTFDYVDACTKFYKKQFKHQE